MDFLFKTWKGRFVSVIVITLCIGIFGRMVDPAYFQYPIGEGYVGLSLEEAEEYTFPATTEIQVMAGGQDPLRIDIAAKEKNITGELEIIGPDDEAITSQKIASRYYPRTVMPNPSRWTTFNTRARDKGYYKVRLTQEQAGKVKIFFYQGPFTQRMLMLPVGGMFVVLIISLLLADKPVKKIE